MSKLSCTRVLAAAVALTFGAHANSQVTSADIVDGQVKTPDIASAAVTAPKIAGNAVTGVKIAGNAVTGAKVQDGSLTGTDILDSSITGADIQDSSITRADINELTLSGINASELNGYNANEIVRVGQAGLTSVVDLPDCSPGLAYLTKTMTFPFNGSVVVISMFTAQVSGIITPRALVARVETFQPGGVAQLGIWSEDHTAYGTSGQRGNLVSPEWFGVGAGENTFVLRVCDPPTRI
jgi:hypothetical protein